MNRLKDEVLCLCCQKKFLEIFKIKIVIYSM